LFFYHSFFRYFLAATVPEVLGCTSTRCGS